MSFISEARVRVHWRSSKWQTPDDSPLFLTQSPYQHAIGSHIADGVPLFNFDVQRASNINNACLDRPRCSSVTLTPIRH
jgi:hypothetical protein